jgi:transcriptional regulator with XRE-family HTH domain
MPTTNRGTPLDQILDAERRRQGLTVYRLAKDAGMSAGRMAAILNGETANPGILTVVAALAALGKSLAWLGEAMDGK